MIYYELFFIVSTWIWNNIYRIFFFLTNLVIKPTQQWHDQDGGVTEWTNEWMNEQTIKWIQISTRSPMYTIKHVYSAHT